MSAAWRKPLGVSLRAGRVRLVIERCALATMAFGIPSWSVRAQQFGPHAYALRLTLQLSSR